MTLKVGHGQKSGPEVNRNSGSGDSHQNHPQGQSAISRDKTYAHDNTPARQRELETHGQNLRAKVEGQSHKHDDGWQSQRSQHSQPSHSSSAKSERGLSVRVNGEKLGVEIEAKVGSNKSHGSDRSHHFHGDFDARSEVHGAKDGIQSKATTSSNPQRHVHSQSSSHHEADKTGTRHDSPEIHREFDRGSEQRWGQRSSESANSAKHLLRDTFKNVRNELHEFRSDHKNGAGHKTIELTDRHIERVIQLATKGSEARFNRGDHPEGIARQVLAEASGVATLADHFSRLESIGGEPVRRAYQAAMSFLLNTEVESQRLQLTTELLRDLASGGFLNPLDMEGPFPLTGRARVVSEMMELMRTIAAIEKFADELGGRPNRSLNGDLAMIFRDGSMRALTGVELLAKALLDSGPTFPGLAGRLEIPRLIAALGGELTDAAGRPLILADGTPLKLGEMLWFNVRPDSVGDLWAIDRFPTRLSPILIHGFDAVYSVIGFDGRPLSLPRFMAIQSQINASEFEWLFGQAPLSEGWIRSAIEFLKDSISFDHNVLGELLEEAVTTGRFHLTVMRGTVEEGKAVSGSFSFAPVG